MTQQTQQIDHSALDANIVSLVEALDQYPGLITIGSCGGHATPTGDQWDAGTFYVKCDVSKNKTGWFAIATVNDYRAWLIVRHRR